MYIYIYYIIRIRISILMCVALPPTHIGGCTLDVGRSTMDDGLLKIWLQGGRRLACIGV